MLCSDETRCVWSKDISVSTVDRIRVARLRNPCLIPGSGKSFLSFKDSSPPLELSQLPTEGVLRYLFL